MTSDVDLLRQAVNEYEKAVRVKNMNQELYDHLLGSIVYLLKYSEKYNVPLPQKDELCRMLNRAQSLIEGIVHANRKFTVDKSTADYTEPLHRFCQLDGSLFSL